MLDENRGTPILGNPRMNHSTQHGVPTMVNMATMG